MPFEKSKAIGYWLSTGLVALNCLAGGAFDLRRPPEVVTAPEHLGYPAYLLGAWK
jgi:hypothetical protein